MKILGNLNLTAYTGNLVSIYSGITERFAIDNSGNVDASGYVDSGDDFRKNGITILDVETGANGNTVFGESAMNIDTISGAIRNTAIGYDSGSAISSGDNHVLIGWGAGRLLSTESNNVAIGSLAMYSHIGQQCVAIGAGALDGAGTGFGNVGIGYQALTGLIGAANDNIAIGRNCMLGATGGTYNIAIGNQSGPATGVGLNNTVSIGRQATPSASNQILFGGPLTNYEELIFGRGPERAGGGGPISFDFRTTDIQDGEQDGSANATITISAARGTGIGTGGKLALRFSPPSTTTGTTQNPIIEMITLAGENSELVFNEEGSNYPMRFETANRTNAIYINSTGDTVGFGTITPTDSIHINGVTGYTQFRLEQSYTPTGSGDTVGNIGSVVWDDTYWYQKTNTGWGRIAWDYAF